MSEKNITVLVSSARKGGSEAFEALMEHYRNDVYDTAYFWVKNETDAEDITQEVFIKVLKNLERLQCDEAFPSWLKMITVNECRMFFRRNKNSAVTVDEEEELDNLINSYQEERTENLPQEKLDRLENDRLLYSLVEELPEKYSRVLIMFYYEEKSYSEISSELRISEGTVKSRLFTAKDKLQASILAFEKKHGIAIHSTDAFGGIGNWLMQALSDTGGFLQTASAAVNSASAGAAANTVSTGAAGAVANTVSTGAAGAVANTVSTGAAGAVVNSVSTGAAAAVSTAMSNAAAARVSIATAAVSVAVCVGITTSFITSNSAVNDIEPERSVISETAPSEYSEETEPSENAEPSVIYIHEEAEPSVIYRDRDVIHEAEPSTVYITAEPVYRYDKYIDITNDNNRASFRLFTESKEATVTSILFNSENLVYPSYVDFEGEKYSVTRIKQYGIASPYFTGEEPQHVHLQLPEKLQSIPDSAFEDMNIETVTGGTNVTRIGNSAFRNCKITELDMRKVFPNVMEIGVKAFEDCPLTKLVLPDGLMTVSMTAFDYIDLEQLTAPAFYDGIELLPLAETVHIVIPGEKIDQRPKVFWRRPENYNGYIVEIENYYIELQNSDAVFTDNKYLDGIPKSSMSDMIRYTAAVNLYLPDGMKKIRTKEFYTETYDESVNPDDYGRIKNLYIPASVKEIENDAFLTPNNMIKNIFLSKSGRTKAELKTLKSQILKSGSFRFVSEDKDYLIFTDPDSVYPEGKYKAKWAEELVPLEDEEEYPEPEEIIEEDEEEYPEPEEIIEEDEEEYPEPEEIIEEDDEEYPEPEEIIEEDGKALLRE